jgi:hypothetical protein
MKRTTEAPHGGAHGGGHGGSHAELSPRLVDRDVNLRAVGLTVAAILGLTIVAAALMWWLLAAFLSGAEAADPRPGPAAAAAPRELPPGPRLQALPEAHAASMRAREELVLSSYGWTEEGGVRIPIERAIDALAARGATLAVGSSEAAAEPELGAAAAAGQPAGGQPSAPPPSAFGAGAQPAPPQPGQDEDGGEGPARGEDR